MQLRTLHTRFLASKSASGCSERTIRLYGILFNGFLKHVTTQGHRESLTNFNSRTIEDYLIHSSRLFPPNTVHNRACSLSSFGRWLVSHGTLQTNPCDRIQRPKQRHPIPDVLSETELAALEAVPLSPEQAAMRALLTRIGLRADEVCELDGRDVRLSMGMLYVRRAKGDSTRAIPLADSFLKAALDAWVGARTGLAPEDPVFPGASTLRLRDEQLRAIVRSWGGKMGRPRLKPHLLRHSFATLWCQRGGDVVVLQKILGHKQLTTTQRYVHLTQTHVAVEIERVLEVSQKLPRNFTMTGTSQLVTP